MEKEYNRTARVAREMQKAIAIILQRQIQDPRISMVTVSGIKISRDLTYIKIFVTFLNEKTPEKAKANIQILQDASSFIRSLLGKTVRLRLVPKLTFFYDNSLTEGMRMSNMIKKIAESDKLRAARFCLNRKG